jgi:hypothetical protein
MSNRGQKFHKEIYQKISGSKRKEKAAGGVNADIEDACKKRLVTERLKCSRLYCA